MPQMSLRPGEVLDVGDVPVLFRATDGVRARGLRGFIAGFGPASAAARVSVTVRARQPAKPRRQADYVVDDFDVWADGVTMHADLGPDGRAMATDSTALVGLTDEGAMRSLHAALLIVLTHLLAQRDRFVLHAGAIASGGAAYVVAGPTGTGKSTLVAAALESGWEALGDDMVVLRKERSGLAVAGIPRPVAVPSDLGSALGSDPASYDPRNRRVVPPSALEPGWFPVAGLIAVGHGTGREGALTALGGVDALRLARHSFTSSGNPVLFRRFFGPAATLARLPGWRLDHGADAATRLAAAQRLLGGVLAGAPGRP